VWALAAFAGGAWWAGGTALAARLAAGLAVGSGVLGDRRVLTHGWLMPLRDLFGFAVWLAGNIGKTVVWRGNTLRLRPDGTIDAIKRSSIS
jgi:ceramide glucosyltransferase